MPLAVVEVLAEDAPADAEPDVYTFAHTTGARIHRWFCRDPFCRVVLALARRR